jgi:hypothetical protein
MFQRLRKKRPTKKKSYTEIDALARKHAVEGGIPPDWLQGADRTIYYMERERLEDLGGFIAREGVD